MEDEKISLIRTFLKNKIVRWVLVVDVVLVLAIIVVFVLDAAKVSVINLNIAPVDATISVNGNTDFDNGMYAVMPGTYEITVSRDGLESKTFKMDIAPNYVVTLTTFLEGRDGNLDFYELKTNYRSYLKLAEIASAEKNLTIDSDSSAESFIANFERIMSISKILPIRGYVYADPNVGASTAGFVIRDGMDMEECKQITCLLVNYYGVGFEEAVVEKIKEAGYNPADYQIIYEKYN